ncbi:MAG: methionine--tRNA ligase [Proteobacteria bacterium]|nr:methionine--tRNA ligase [Pseudomonadota bacterium]
MEKPFYITTPIYYVNDKPHIGHAYTSLACDMIARFKQLDGFDVKFLTGTDEHGQKIEKAAAAKGVDPQDFVDEVSVSFSNLCPLLNLTNTDFIRTTESRHKAAVQYLWQQLLDSGNIYLGEYAGWYAVRDEAFYQEDEIVNGKAPTGAEVEWIKESSYFFKLSAWQQPLLDYYSKHPEAIQPESRRNEVLRFIEGGLKDLSISRRTLKWGVPVPGDPDHVMYVWLDALTNYLSALGYPNAGYEPYWNQAIHVVGKDILRFHSVYWPAFLMAAQLPLPKTVFAHGWWMVEGEKMSKSLGNVIDPVEVVATYGSDAFRYFMLRDLSFGQDGDFSQSAFIGRLNTDLANAYGNLCQRVLSFIYKNAEATVPTPGDFEEADKALLAMPNDLLPTLRKQIDNFQLHRYCETVWQIIGEANRYVDAQKPWSLKKEDPARMATVLYVLTEIIRQVAILTQPILPLTSFKILAMLGVEDKNFASLKLALKPGFVIPEPQPLFAKY